MDCLFEFKYEEKVLNSLDPYSKFSQFFDSGLFLERAEFEEKLESDSQFRPFGSKISEYQREDEKFEVKKAIFYF